MKVINLFAGPGAGKSTTAAGLFFLMKVDEYKVELVTEYAKDVTYEEGYQKLKNQSYIFGKQLQRLERVRPHVDWAITDSPLPLATLYTPPGYPQSFQSLVMETFHLDENYNFFIERVKPYKTYGRSQDEAAARVIDERTKDLLNRCGVAWMSVKGDRYAPQEIFEQIKKRFEERAR